MKGWAMITEDRSFLKIDEPAEHPGVLVATIDRAPVNALSIALFAQVRGFFQTVADRKGVRCVVLTGASGFFSAGADVKELSERTTESQLARSVISRATFDAIRRCPAPVIAAVNGPAVGAGVVFASCCDLIIASERATFSLPEILVGVMGGTRYLARLVPDKVVRYLALTGRKVDARFLERFGAILEIVPHEDLRTHALAFAVDIAGKSPSAVRLMKESINLTEDMRWRKDIGPNNCSRRLRLQCQIQRKPRSHSWKSGRQSGRRPYSWEHHV